MYVMRGRFFILSIGDTQNSSLQNMLPCTHRYKSV
jgi:hypothetical protein